MISSTPYNKTHNKVSARLTRGKEVLLPFLSALSNTIVYVRIKQYYSSATSTWLSKVIHVYNCARGRATARELHVTIVKPQCIPSSQVKGSDSPCRGDTSP